MKKFLNILLFFTLFIAFFAYYISKSDHLASVQGGAHHMEHNMFIIPSHLTPPSVEIKISQDPSGSYLLNLQTNHFTFAPEKVGHQVESIHEGHAHLYINEKKVTRLYGPYYDLGSLKKGENVIKVSLNANNHDRFFYAREPIEDSIKIEVK